MGFAYDDSFVLNFGKHKGKALANVPASYLIYIFENKMVYDNRLKSYIYDNWGLLRKEADKEKGFNTRG